MNDSTILVDSKNMRRTQQEKKRVNKRKENLFFTLFMLVLCTFVTWLREREKNRKLVTQSNPLPRYTKRTIWNYFRLDATAILHIYILLSRGQTKTRRMRRRNDFSFEYVPTKKKRKRKKKKKKHDVDIYPFAPLSFLYLV